jgi:hypothetical protein
MLSAKGNEVLAFCLPREQCSNLNASTLSPHIFTYSIDEQEGLEIEYLG